MWKENINNLTTYSSISVTARTFTIYNQSQAYSGHYSFHMKEPLLENDSYGETVKTFNKKGRKRTLYGVTGCTFPSFASLNKKVKSICLLKRGTSVRQASAHLEIAISRQMKAEWFETLAENTSLAGLLIFKQAGLIDMHLPLLPSPTLSCPLPFLPPSL